MKQNQNQAIITLLSIAVFLLGIALPKEAIGKPREKKRGRLKLEASCLIGYSMENHPIGQSTSGGTIELGAGGGMGWRATLGITLMPLLDIDLLYGTVKSMNQPKASDGKGYFKRDLILSTLKFKIPIFSSMGQFKIGIGAGYYTDPVWNVEVYAVSPQFHERLEYKPAYGYHTTLEYEGFFPSGLWSLSLGVIYYGVTYKIDTATYDALPVPTSSLNKEFRELDGSGYEFTIGIGRYF